MKRGASSLRAHVRGARLAERQRMVAAQALARTAPATFDDVAHGELGSMFATGELVADAYIVRSVLGTGGMGQVYAADDLELRRQVAIKANIIERSEQLRQEAQALAQVHHRNIVGVHRFGVHRGVPFLVMERLYGRTLAEHIAANQLRGRPMDLDEALELLAAIASALAGLHDVGVAHLDLKPDNVMVCAGRRVVLFDLGIMLPEVSAGPREPCGTPLYMAPELIEGTLARGRACRADLYSFGSLAHELLTGRPIFDATDPAAILTCHLLDEPIDPRELRPELPARVAALVQTCLAKHPEQRPESAEEIAWELFAAQRQLPRPGPRSTR
jgi:serine/threonine protein kinase